jgi:nitrile hydratase beta subunit
MNGIHDMGGMHGFGPVRHDQPAQHARIGWEARLDNMREIVEDQGWFNTDEFRYGIEQMPPAEYLRASYFERWLATVEYNLGRKGVLEEGEVERRVALLQRQPDYQPHTPQQPRLAPTPTAAADAAPLDQRFAVGDAVRVRNVHPTHHTRAPRYTRGKRGVINIVHGPEIFPDTNAHGLGKNPQVVYSVRFDARELWGADAEPNQTVSIDLWESYLETAP